MEDELIRIIFEVRKRKVLIECVGTAEAITQKIGSVASAKGELGWTLWQRRALSELPPEDLIRCRSTIFIYFSDNGSSIRRLFSSHDFLRDRVVFYFYLVCSFLPYLMFDIVLLPCCCFVFDFICSFLLFKRFTHSADGVVILMFTFGLTLFWFALFCFSLCFAHFRHFYVQHCWFFVTHTHGNEMSNFHIPTRWSSLGLFIALCYGSNDARPNFFVDILPRRTHYLLLFSSW